jgi:hypothetical protein
VAGEWAAAYHRERARQGRLRRARLEEWDYLAHTLAEQELARSVGAGWSRLVVGLHRSLLELDPDYRLYAVGERLGLLRYDVRLATPVETTGVRAIAEAQVTAATTCVVCTAPARLRVERPVPRALCGKCWSADRAAAHVQSERFAEALLSYLMSADPAYPGPEETLAWLDSLESS